MKGIQLGLTLLFIITIVPHYMQGADYTMEPDKDHRKGDEWIEGLVTFSDGKTIRCEFSYNPQKPEELLKIKDGDKIIKGTVFNVKSFAYYDVETLSEHKFFSFPVNDDHRMFVELLYKDAFYSILGGESILNKESVEDNDTTASEAETHYQRFLIDMQQGLMYELTLSILSSLMEDRAKEIKEFISDHKLQFEDVHDYVLVIREYERLTK